ncbi:hypothetical protein [Psychrobacillus antarcticus]|uniref:hypothetical protein n=1 Tax=Psychrobacillus antarcticus TaxID=2879115 RepID=UPI0024083E6D|nr:hypothetical protein [Psychrobacillus antarcticus]
MFKPSKYVNDICPGCSPQKYIKTISKFTGKSETYEDLPEANHHLYKCVKCGEKVWLDEQWIKNNAVEVEEKKKVRKKRQ